MTMNPGRNFSLSGCFGLSNGSNCHPLIYNEQDIFNNLGDANTMSIINGGTWTLVLYRVQLHNQSRAMLVKKLQNETGSAEDASLNNHCQSEVNLLAGSIHHDNIISLEDCFRESSFILLVYNHKENGSLHQWLHNPADLTQLGAQGGILDWPTRRAIAIGVAEGLYYMHHGCNNPIVHHNVNSASILLDTDLKAKVAGFDLAQVNLAGHDQPVPICEPTALNMFGFTAPEYVTVVTAKVDVYSFGVVLLEIVTGRVANEAIVDGHLATWAGGHCNRLMKNSGDFSRVIDKAIPDRARYLKEMVSMFKLGVDCTVREPQERPSMHDVLYRQSCLLCTINYEAEYHCL